ncbi:DUF1735 domain-containing protein [uncultured Porphyromonas sp.]|jgi:hypothetical protein|uniref:BT_3987 domain-containing protein n=1 Tax=uncultured Porphyromonas sp. TaxID=159274 RepID=UPI00260C393D|nr:DUF1735 domain-containing protein [uncultured Porphyromonas sp.]
MKRLAYTLLAVGLLASCQNELYEDPAKTHKVEQGVYIQGQELTQIFLLDGASENAQGPRVTLVRPATSAVTVGFTVGSQAQLDAYNAKNGTSYTLLPSSMYEISSSVTIPAGQITAPVPVKLKNVTFAAGQIFALPLKLNGEGTHAIGGQSEAMIIVDQATETKVMRINTGNEIATYFTENISVPQWTMEIMVNRSNINGALAGTKFVGSGDDKSEIYPVVGKEGSFLRTGGTDLTLSKDAMPLEDNKWYMFSFVYDGANVSVYSNGHLVLQQAVRDGDYKLGGFWLSTTRGMIRELRFYKVARTPQQIAANVWKMADPKDTNLVAYYPMNGKKYDHATGTISDDETQIWDWSANGHHFTNLQGATFVKDGDKLFRFPLAK